jgi:hypothetical protein
MESSRPLAWLSNLRHSVEETDQRLHVLDPTHAPMDSSLGRPGLPCVHPVAFVD